MIGEGRGGAALGATGARRACASGQSQIYCRACGAMRAHVCANAGRRGRVACSLPHFARTCTRAGGRGQGRSFLRVRGRGGVVRARELLSCADVCACRLLHFRSRPMAPSIWPGSCSLPEPGHNGWRQRAKICHRAGAKCSSSQGPGRRQVRVHRAPSALCLCPGASPLPALQGLLQAPKTWSLGCLAFEQSPGSSTRA